jgi:hypothetical protein
MHKDMFEVEYINPQICKLTISLTDTKYIEIHRETSRGKTFNPCKQVRNLLKIDKAGKTYTENYLKTLQEESRKQGWEMIYTKDDSFYSWYRY